MVHSSISLFATTALLKINGYTRSTDLICFIPPIFFVDNPLPTAGDVCNGDASQNARVLCQIECPESQRAPVRSPFEPSLTIKRIFGYCYGNAHGSKGFRFPCMRKKRICITSDARPCAFFRN